MSFFQTILSDDEIEIKPLDCVKKDVPKQIISEDETDGTLNSIKRKNSPKSSPLKRHSITIQEIDDKSDKVVNPSSNIDSVTDKNVKNDVPKEKNLPKRNSLTNEKKVFLNDFDQW